MRPSSAVISQCGAYRYLLRRTVGGGVRRCLFCMLNPSTADASIDDPTIRRCIGFAQMWACWQLTVINLFGLRATNPKQLPCHPDPIGPDAWEHFSREVTDHWDGLIVAAWGATPIARTMSVHHEVLRSAGAKCLGMNRDGSPKHPLYVPASTPLIPWEVAA